MKIVMLQRRKLESGKPGTLLKNFAGSGIDYLFAPQEADGPHVCEVKDRDHIKRFLSIPDGFDLDESSDAGDSEDAGSIKDDIEDELAKEPVVSKHDPWPSIMTIDFEAMDPKTNTKVWPMKRLRLFAEQSMGISNANSKKEIAEYAEEVYGIQFPSSVNTASKMLKELITDIQTVKAQEVEQTTE